MILESPTTNCRTPFLAGKEIQVSLFSKLCSSHDYTNILSVPTSRESTTAGERCKALGIPEKIKRIEEDLHRTQINKKTEHHIGLLKARLAKLKRELEEQTSRRGGSSSQGYDIRKSGDATVVLIGLPSVGKSTLLNKLTNAKS